MFQILFILYSVVAVTALTSLKGNLLFQEVGGRQLNPEHLTFSRKVDSSDLEAFAKALQGSANLYDRMCRAVETLKSDMDLRLKAPDKRLIVVGEGPVNQARAMCQKHDAELPEIYNKHQQLELEQLMTEHKIKQTAAGLTYDKIGKQIIFNSNAQPWTISVFPKIYYGGSYTGAWHPASGVSDTYLTAELSNFPLVYAATDEGIRLRVIDSNKMNDNQLVICHQPNTIKQLAAESSMFVKLVSHTCQRDGPVLNLETSASLKDILTITTFVIDSTPDNSTLQNYSPQYRQKRSLGALGSASVFGTLFGGATYILKSILDSVFGSTSYAKQKDLLKLAHEMNNLRINQQQLQQVTGQVTQAIKTMEARIQNIYTGIGTMRIESEIKELNRHLQSVLGITLLKYSAALQSAKDKRAHPYSLSQHELSNLSSTYFTQQRIHLDSNIDNVITTFVLHNNTLFFLFNIPILHDDKFFNFYNIIPIPTFANNNTYIPDIDASNIAISKNGDKYTTLTNTEMNKCMAEPPICTSHKPISPITNQALCVVSTYRSTTLTCPLRLTGSVPQPFLHFNENHLFFSVPNPTNLYIKCHENSLSNDYTDKTVSISGIGQASYKPSCTINLPDGTFYKTPSEKIIIWLTQDVFNLAKSIPHSAPTLIQFPNMTQIQYEMQPGTFTEINEFLTDTSILDILINIITMLVPICVTIPFFIWLHRKLKQQTSNNNKASSHMNPEPQFWYESNSLGDASPTLRTTQI